MGGLYGPTALTSGLPFEYMPSCEGHVPARTGSIIAAWNKTFHHHFQKDYQRTSAQFEVESSIHSLDLLSTILQYVRTLHYHDDIQV